MGRGADQRARHMVCRYVASGVVKFEWRAHTDTSTRHSFETPRRASQVHPLRLSFHLGYLDEAHL